MANAQKLPSGAWRTRAAKVVNGKTLRKSFTVSPDECGGNSKKAKALSELQAREWVMNTALDINSEKTVKDAITMYIDDRSKILSPRTINDYRLILPYYESIWDIYISDIETPQIQRFINEWSVSLKAKTIRNRINLLLASLDFAGCDKKFKLRYPMGNSKKILSPDLEDVQMLINAADDDFKPILYLAAFGGLRRGEIAALKQEDISRDMCTIYVHADVIWDGKKWFYKPFPKNGESGVIGLPRFVIDSLPDREGYIFNTNPTTISHKYDRLRKKLGFPYNMHSLRHFAASFRSDIGIPSKYIEEVGRWKNSVVMKQVYDNTLNSSRKKYTQMANRFLEENFEPGRKSG